MNDGGNGNGAFVNSIDDSIAVSEPFTNIFIIELRHYATGKRKL